MSALTNNFVSETRCVGETTCFTWKICDYHLSPLKNKSFLRSDFFVFYNIHFRLTAQYVHVNSPISDGIVPGNCLFVHLTGDRPLTEVDFIYSISLKNSNNKHECQNHGFVKRGQNADGLYIINETKVSNSTGLLVDDCLTIFCKMVSLQITHKSEDLQTQGTALCCSPADVLSRDLWSLFVTTDAADFVFRVEGQDIAVHSQILAARSSVFAAMFRSDFKENRTRVIHITDMGISSIHCLLQYIYTGEAWELKGLPPNSLTELYNAAEKYDLKELKDMCSQVIQTTLSKDNVESYANLAFTHDDQNIMAAVVILFGSNKELIDSDLMHELTRKIPTFPVQVLKFVSREMPRSHFINII